MNEIQKNLLNILKWFDEFCDENGLSYYVTGGTALGAKRHKGFIPWDDDIDVGMPRPDYEKLCELMKDRQGKYVLEPPCSENKDYLYLNAKIYDTETTAIEKVRTKCKRGLFLDIFPVDGIGNDLEEAKKTFKKFYYKNMFIATRTSVVRKERKWWKNASIILSRAIPECIVNTKKLVCKFDEEVACKDFDSSKYIAAYVGVHDAEQEIYNKNIIFPIREYEFEGLRVKGPNNIDSFLSQLYGDWKKLPPEDKRNSGHDFIYIDLNKAYLNENNIER